MSEVILLSSDEGDDPDGTIKKSHSLLNSPPHNDQNGIKFHPPEQNMCGYQGFENFIQYCTDIEVNKRGGCPETMKIISGKILSKYKEADPDYTKSEAFQDIITLAHKKVEKDPSRLFVYLKEVSDELKLRSFKKRIKRCRNSIKNGDEPKSKCAKVEAVISEDSTCDSEIAINKRHVEKLERLFQKVHEKVKKLESKEVDWDKDEENSNYIKWSRYSNRLCCIWEKLQEAKGCLETVKRLKSSKIVFAGTPYPTLNQVITTFVNRTQKFPDFFDIRKLTSETLNQDKKITSDELHRIATSAFQSLGDQLQKSRVYDFWNSFLTFLPPEVEGADDPADKDETLAQKLLENQKTNAMKMEEVMNSFVNKQESLKLEPEELPEDVDDENYKSAGEEGQEESEEEQEEENAEDIIAISSSSDENEEEGTCNSKGKSNLCENGDNGDCTDVEVEEAKEAEQVRKVANEFDEVTKKGNELMGQVNKVKEEKVEKEVKESKLTPNKGSLLKELRPIASCSLGAIKKEVTNSYDDEVVEISD